MGKQTWCQSYLEAFLQTHLIPSTQRSEVLNCLGQGIAVQAKSDSPYWLAINGHVKEGLMSNRGIRRRWRFRFYRRWPAVMTHDLLFQCHMNHAAKICLFQYPKATYSIHHKAVTRPHCASGHCCMACSGPYHLYQLLQAALLTAVFHP